MTNGSTTAARRTAEARVAADAVRWDGQRVQLQDSIIAVTVPTQPDYVQARGVAASVAWLQ